MFLNDVIGQMDLVGSTTVYLSGELRRRHEQRQSNAGKGQPGRTRSCRGEVMQLLLRLWPRLLRAAAEAAAKGDAAGVSLDTEIANPDTAADKPSPATNTGTHSCVQPVRHGTNTN